MKTHRLIAILAGIAACMGTLVAATNTFPTSGNVGIGTTSPQALLEIKKPSGGRWQFVDEGADVYQAINIRNAANTAFLPLTIRSLGLEINDGVAARLSISSSGNVGIGTTSPQFKLTMGPLSGDTGDHITTLFNNGIYAVEVGVYGTESIVTMRSSDSWNVKIQIPTDGNVVFNNGGNFGIGTTSPGSKLDVVGGLHATDSATLGDGHWGTEGMNYTALSTFGGTVVRGNSLNVGQFTIGAWSQSAPTNGLFVAGNTILNSNVGIGTTNPTEKLAVNGRIRAKEVVVETNWSDYVFDSDYRLAPLSEIERHIRAEKHLPGIPSRGEVAAQGVSVGEMQAKLLQKIEELTLYVIAQDKRIQKLEEENHQLRSSR